MYLGEEAKCLCKRYFAQLELAMRLQDMRTVKLNYEAAVWQISVKIKLLIRLVLTVGILYTLQIIPSASLLQELLALPTCVYVCLRHTWDD